MPVGPLLNVAGLRGLWATSVFLPAPTQTDTRFSLHENATTLWMSDSRRRMCPRPHACCKTDLSSSRCPTPPTPPPVDDCGRSYKAADLLHPQPGPACLRLSVTSGVPSGGLMEARCELLLARHPTGTKAPAGPV